MNRSARRTRRHIRERGFSFLEAVAAAAVLGLVAAMILSSVNNLIAGQKRSQQRLACAEIANRIILQYLDDKKSLPAGGAPIPYAGSEYRWSMRESSVAIVPARPEIAAERAGTSSLSIDRLSHISVRVWLSEASGGSAAYDEAVPHAAMSRLMDPIARAGRNPDSAAHLFSDTGSEQFQEFMADLQRYGTGNRRPAGTPPPSRRPAPAKGDAK